MKRTQLIPWEIMALTACVESAVNRKPPPDIHPDHLRILLRQLERTTKISLTMKEENA